MVVAVALHHNKKRKKTEKLGRSLCAEPGALQGDKVLKKDMEEFRLKNWKEGKLNALSENRQNILGEFSYISLPHQNVRTFVFFLTSEYFQFVCFNH